MSSETAREKLATPPALPARRFTVPSASANLVPHSPTLDALRDAVEGCRACDLWKLARRPSSAKGAHAPRDCSSASSRETSKTGADVRSWDGPVGYWTRR